MTEQPNAERTEREANAEPVRRGWLRNVRTFALAVVVALPPTINAQNIVGWANAPDGLGLPIAWAWVAFADLDLIALVCVLETIVQTQQGRKAGAFAALVWAFAGASAYAGYRHGLLPGVGRDVIWFFPFMAFAGPVLLHLVLKRARLDRQLDQGKRLTHASAGAFGWSRWVPGVGAFGETYCAWRLGRLEGIVHPQLTIDRYRTLRPDAGRSGLRVLRSLRVEAERLRVTERANADRPVPAAVESPAVERSVEPKPDAAANDRTRTVKTNGRPASRPNGGGQTFDERMARLRDQFRGRRSDPPPVSEVALFLGLAKSSAHPYQKALVAELVGQGDDDQEREPALTGTG